MRLNLLVRINIALLATLALATFIMAYACESVLESNARRDTLREAGLMMDSALANRAYTSEEIVPLLGEPMKSHFLPQSIPFYAATQNFLRLREHHPDYTYKEATLNPTNPRDRAMDWEADLIQRFKNDSKSEEIVGTRATPLGESLYLARPIRAEAECMSCHSLPSAAPATLIARYGTNNGFGWQANEVVGAQIVSIPFDRAMKEADGVFRRIMLVIALTMIAVVLLVNVLLYAAVVRPVRRIAALADEISLGGSPAERFPTAGSPELAGLARAFERMRVSLERALQLAER
jgi:protein-histidine pros-kinase